MSAKLLQNIVAVLAGTIGGFIIYYIADIILSLMEVVGGHHDPGEPYTDVQNSVIFYAAVIGAFFGGAITYRIAKVTKYGAAACTGLVLLLILLIPNFKIAKAGIIPLLLIIPAAVLGAYLMSLVRSKRSK